MLKDLVQKHFWKIRSFKVEVSMNLAMIVLPTDVRCDGITCISTEACKMQQHSCKNETY